MKTRVISDTKTLNAIPREAWPPTWQHPSPDEQRHAVLGAWASRKFLVVLWREHGCVERLQVQRTSFKGAAPFEWKEDITWDDLQRLKAEAGFGDRWAVEVFPAAGDVVNVVNIRHLWLLDAPPASFGWKRPAAPAAPAVAP